MNMVMQREPEHMRISEETKQSVKLLSNSLEEKLDGILDNPHIHPAEVAPSEPVRNFGFARGIVIEDVALDIDNFAVMLSVGRQNRVACPALVIGQTKAIPLLPGNNVRLDPLGVDPEVSAGLIRFMQTVSKVSILWPEARDLFVSGLVSFMEARVQGLKWAGEQKDERLRASLSGNVGIPGGNAAPPASGQWWTIQTRRPGLNIYYAGTHAARQPPNFAGGTTAANPLLTVFLPMGTLYIGADSLPNGSHDWDQSSVTVPSPKPHFTSKRF